MEAFTGMDSFYIWRLENGEPAGKRLLRYGFFYPVLLVLVVVALIFVMTLALIGVPEELRKWLLLAVVIGITFIVVMMALRFGRKGMGAKYAFARDGQGRIYLFDYTAPAFASVAGVRGMGRYHADNPVLTFQQMRRDGKAIERMEDSGILEEIMRAGCAEAYGSEVVQVSGLRMQTDGFRAVCTLRRSGGGTYSRRLAVPAEVENYEVLFAAFQRMQG